MSIPSPELIKKVVSKGTNSSIPSSNTKSRNSISSRSSRSSANSHRTINYSPSSLINPASMTTIDQMVLEPHISNHSVELSNSNGGASNNGGSGTEAGEEIVRVGDMEVIEPTDDRGNSPIDQISLQEDDHDNDHDNDHAFEQYEQHEQHEEHGPIDNDEHPVWQENSEVNVCPLCGSKFSFFNRKHHCRKCGRVICGNCCDNFIRYLPYTYVVEAGENGGRLIRNCRGRCFRTCNECVEEIRMLKRALGEDDEDDEDNDDDNDDDDDHERDDDDEYDNRREIQVDDEISRYTSGSILDNVLEGSRVRGCEENTSKAQPMEITMELSESNSNIHNRNEEEEEENHCPICNKDLHKINEIERENHINSCLMDQEFGSPVNGKLKRDRNRMLVYRIPKDANEEELCINEDNECVICLEEFKTGDKVARLECLCCFHYKCIKDWIKKKGFVECPVHALHFD